MLTREIIFDLLTANGKQPQYAKGFSTIIENNTDGTAYYILEYNGNARVGWGLYEGPLKYLKSFPKSAIILINSQTADGAGEMFFILDAVHFVNALKGNVSPYMVDRQDVATRGVSYENFEDYLS